MTDIAKDVDKEQKQAVVGPMPFSREERIELLKKCEGGWEDVDIETSLQELRRMWREWTPPDWS